MVFDVHAIEVTTEGQCARDGLVCGVPAWSFLQGGEALSRYSVRLDCGWDAIIAHQCLLYVMGQEGKRLIPSQTCLLGSFRPSWTPQEHPAATLRPGFLDRL